MASGRKSRNHQDEDPYRQKDNASMKAKESAEQQEDESFRSTSVMFTLRDHSDLKQEEECHSHVILLNATAAATSFAFMICYLAGYHWLDSFNTPLLGDNAYHEYALIATIILSIIVTLATLFLGSVVILLCCWAHIHTKTISWIAILIIAACLLGLLTMIGIGTLGYYYINVWRLLPTFLLGVLIPASYCVLSLVSLHALHSKENEKKKRRLPDWTPDV